MSGALAARRNQSLCIRVVLARRFIEAVTQNKLSEPKQNRDPPDGMTCCPVCTTCRVSAAPTMLEKYTLCVNLRAESIANASFHRLTLDR